MAYYSNIIYPYQQSDAEAAGGRGSISEELAAIKADIAYLYSYKMKTENPVFTGNISGNSGTIPLLHGPVTLSDGDLSICCNLYVNGIKANGSLNTENIVNLNNITVKPNSTLSINGSASITNGDLTVPNERVTGQSVVNCLYVNDINCGIHNSGPYYFNDSTVQESGYTTVDAAIKNLSADVGDIDSIRVYPYCCPLFASCTKFPIVYGSNEDYTTNYQNIAIDKTQYYCRPENKLYLSNIKTGNIDAIDTISSATLNVTGTVSANEVSTGSVKSTGTVSGTGATFTSVTTPSVCGSDSLTLCGGPNAISIDITGAYLTYACFCAPILQSNTACVTDTANICTANICTACIDDLQSTYFSYDSTNNNLKIGGTSTSTITGYCNYIINGYSVNAHGCTTFINSTATDDVSIPSGTVFINGYANGNVSGVYINGTSCNFSCHSNLIFARTELAIGDILAACVDATAGSLNCEIADAILRIFAISRGGTENYIYSYPFMGYIYKEANPHILCTATSRIEFCFDSSDNEMVRIVEQHGCCYEFRSNCTSAETGDWKIRGMIYRSEGNN